MIYRIALLSVLFFISPSMQLFQCPQTWDCQGEGLPCGAGVSCNSGLYCSSASSTSNGQICARSNIGAPCGSSSNCYGDSVQCVGNTGNRHCQIVKNAGQSCSQDLDCSSNGFGGISGRCVNGKCFVGQPWNSCTSDSECQDVTQINVNPNVCSTVSIGQFPAPSTRTCQIPVGSGAECLTTQNPAPCQLGLYCDSTNHCQPRPNPGDACVQGSGATCMYSSCLPAGPGGALQCTPLLSVPTGQQVCNPTLGCFGNSQLYCQSMMFDPKTGKCVDYTAPVNFGIACNATQYCNTPTDSRLSCQCTTLGMPTALGTCVSNQQVAGLPYINACQAQLSAIITSCKITNSIGDALLPPYPLGTDGLKTCCQALKDGMSCFQGQSYIPGLTYGDSVLKCGQNTYSQFVNNVCSGKSLMFAAGSRISVSLALVIAMAFIVFNALF